MQVISVSPLANSTDIVLGQPIEVVFDEPIDQASVTTATFALYGPGQTALVDASEMLRQTPDAKTGREYVTGTFSFPEPSRLVFTPGRPLRPSVTYTVTLAGGTSTLATSVIKAVGGTKLAQSYSFKFTTGTLNLVEPPPVSPLPEENPLIPVDEIRIIPRKVLGNDLAQEIWIYFPDEIDPNSLDPSYSGGQADADPFNDILVTLDALLDDPQVKVPADAKFSVTAEANILKIRLLPA